MNLSGLDRSSVHAMSHHEKVGDEEFEYEYDPVETEVRHSGRLSFIRCRMGSPC